VMKEGKKEGRKEQKEVDEGTEERWNTPPR
jgi:hypothetical protein